MAVINSNYTVTSTKTELEGMLHGTTLAQITSVNSVFNRAARQVLLDIDPAETKRISQTNTIYENVFDYSAPTDLKGDKVIDVRPQVSRRMSDIFIKRYGQEFDTTKNINGDNKIFNVKYNNGTKSLRIASPLTNSAILLNMLDSVTGNGTWSGSGATNLVADSINYADGSASLKFDLSSGADPTTSYIENSTFSSVDLSDLEGASALFLWVYLPTASGFTSISLRWGSSSANYWSVTATTTHEGNSFNNGWNLIRFDWTASTTETGTADSSAVDYARISFTFNGTAQSGVRANGLWNRLGVVYDIEYYSKYLFASSAGVYQETVDDDSNYINLDTDAYNVFLWQLALQAAHQQHSQNANFDINYYIKNYDEAKNKYIRQYPSEVQKGQSQYYIMPNRGYGGYYNK